GLDIGTTNCKLVAFSVRGDEIASASAPYDVHRPQAGRAEIEPADIITAVVELFRRIAPRLAGYQDLSLAISSQGEAFTLVDKAGNALIPAPISVDMRGLDLVAEFATCPEVEAARGVALQTLNALTSLSKLLWIKRNDSAVLTQAHRFLCMGDFVQQSLGLSPVMDYSMAARTGLLDIATLDWSSDLIRLAESPNALFPPVAPSGTFIGTLSRDMAKRLGLTATVNIFTGGHDQLCAQLGAGALAPRTALYSVGTTECITLTLNETRPDLIDKNLPAYPHVIPGKFAILIGSQSGGRLLEWFATLVETGSMADLFDQVDDLPSRALVIPHFAGTGSLSGDERARGAIAGLSFGVTKPELAHAFLEGITFEQAMALDEAKRHGIELDRLRMVGGGTQSREWMQIKADIIGLPLDCVSNPETACTGAAMLGGFGAGVYPTLQDAARTFERPCHTYMPRADHSAIYADRIAMYRELSADLKKHQSRHWALVDRIEALKSDANGGA
ncbi:MAG: FGGY-family carbohydrate kinase, partial [Pseudomonadota bacterium]